MIVEDEPLFRDILTQWLHRAFPGRDIETAASLGEAQRLIADEEPEVIVADPGLLDSQGVATILALHKAAPQALVIGITGSVHQMTQEQAHDAGAELFVEKEAQLQENVIASIADRLRRRSPNRAAMRKVLSR